MEVRLSFYVHGVDLDPDRVTQHLQAQPTKTRRRGDLHHDPRVRPAKCGSWVYHHPMTGSAVADVASFLQFLKAVPPLTDFPGVDRCFVDVYVPLREGGEVSTTEFALTPEFSSTLAALNCGLELTFTVISRPEHAGEGATRCIQ